MRQYKFRGKRLDNGEWVYGYYAEELPGLHSIYCRTDGALQFVEVDPATVGQFIGAKDKNGRGIYEGDIDGSEPDAEMIVVFEDCAFGLKYPDQDQYFDTCIIWNEVVVIGNIHDTTRTT